MAVAKAVLSDDSSEDEIEIDFVESGVKQSTVLPTWATVHPPLYSFGSRALDEPLVPSKGNGNESSGQDDASGPTDLHKLAPKSSLDIYGDSPVLNQAASLATGPLIRLLQILPGDYKQIIECRLVTRPVFDAPSYLALSYAWGHNEPAFFGITVNGKQFFVSGHLHGAIRRLRAVDKIVNVWIDAICINQQNLIDKSSQIQLMAQIYDRASEVRIWLGVSPYALDYNEMQPHELAATLLQHTLPWWKRLWIIQESAYANSCPIVMLGITMLLKLEDFVQLLHDTLLSISPDLQRVLKKEVLDYIEMPYQTWQSQSHRLPVLERLRQTVGRQYSDPHDRVYALLNVVDETQAPWTKPNYHKPYWKLKWEVDDYLATKADYTAKDQDLLVLEEIPTSLRISFRIDLESAAGAGDHETVRAILRTPRVSNKGFEDHKYGIKYARAAELDFGATVLQAAKRDDTLLMDLLFSHGAEPTEAAFLAAAKAGHRAAMSFLLAREVDINALGPDGTAMELATSNNDMDSVMFLLGHNAEMEDSLVIASARGFESMVKLLMEKGADPNYASPRSTRQALDGAAAGDHLSIVTMLIDNGATYSLSISKQWKGFSDEMRRLLSDRGFV